MRITFTQTVQYETGGRNQGPIYEEGSTHDFSDDFARRWLRRNVAVIAGDEAPAVPAQTEDPAEQPVLDVALEGGGEGGGGKGLIAEAKAFARQVGRRARGGELI